MKKVIIPNSIAVVDCDKVSYSKYYGVQRAGHTKGFIVSESDRYVALSCDHFTRGNGWPHLTKQTNFVLAIKEIASVLDVYEFDTYQELFTWLLEK